MRPDVPELLFQERHGQETLIMEEKPLFQIALERILDRILALPQDKRKEALSFLTDFCLPVPPPLREEDVRKFLVLIGLSALGPLH